jgi:hypothetical protein
VLKLQAPLQQALLGITKHGLSDQDLRHRFSLGFCRLAVAGQWTAVRT